MKPDIVVLTYFINDGEPMPTYPKESWLDLHSAAWIVLNYRLDSLIRQFGPRPEWKKYYRDLYEDNAPGWKTLFVQAVGNHLMAYGSYKPPGRGEAARLEAAMDDTRAGVGRFLGRMAQAKLDGFRYVFGQAERTDHDAAAAAARAVDPVEAGWLKARVDGDGAVDSLEQALIAFIAEESGRAR